MFLKSDVFNYMGGWILKNNKLVCNDPIYDFLLFTLINVIYKACFMQLI